MIMMRHIFNKHYKYKLKENLQLNRVPNQFSQYLLFDSFSYTCSIISLHDSSFCICSLIPLWFLPCPCSLIPFPVLGPWFLSMYFLPYSSPCNCSLVSLPILAPGSSICTYSQVPLSLLFPWFLSL